MIFQTHFRHIYIAVKRIINMIRGIGNPLVAIYARCYLCRVGILISTSPEDYLKENFLEILNIYNEVDNICCLIIII